MVGLPRRQWEIGTALSTIWVGSKGNGLGRPNRFLMVRPPTPSTTSAPDRACATDRHYRRAPTINLLLRLSRRVQLGDDL